MFGNGSGAGMAVVGSGLDGGCVRRGLSEVRSGLILGAAFTAVWRGVDDTGGFAFGWRGRLVRGVASGGRSAGGDGVGRLKDSVAGWVEVFHGMLMDGAAWRSGTSGRKGCGSAGGGIVGDVKGVDGVGCVVMAREANVGGEWTVDGEAEGVGNAA